VIEVGKARIVNEENDVEKLKREPTEVHRFDLTRLMSLTHVNNLFHVIAGFHRAAHSKRFKRHLFRA